MPAPRAKPVSLAEAKVLFAGFERAPALVLAVSGGPDSTALMWLAARWRAALKGNKPQLIAVTVDHGLRQDSKREAAQVARLARRLGLAHRTLRWTGKKPATGLQQAARRARYALLAAAAARAGARHILTAHTLGDQAETVLIRMSRGSGLTGLAAMQRVAPLPTAKRAPSPLAGEGWGGGRSDSLQTRKLPPSRLPSLSAQTVDLPRKGGGEVERPSRSREDVMMLLRPLLDVPKERLIATLHAVGITFAEDPSNRDPHFTRARLRALMPALAREGLDAPRLSLLARRLKRADAALEAYADHAMASLAENPTDSGRIMFQAQAFAQLPAELGLRLLGRAVARLGDEGPVELGKLEALQAALVAAPSSLRRFRRTLAGAVVTLADGRLTVERAPPRRRKALTKAQAGKAKRKDLR